VELMRLLIDYGARVNGGAGAADGTTALMSATRAGEVEAVRLLLEQGAQVHAKDAQGRTALDIAQEEGWEEVGALLRQAEQR
jgi:ankyrin repeat protein